MKRNLLLLFSFALVFMGCERDNTPNIVINDNSTTTINNGGTGPGNGVITLSGVYSQDLTLDADQEYLITGPVLMADGTTLTVPAGMTIRVEPVGVNAYIAVQQGATIQAIGNASNPIVFTSNASSPSSGDWGGIVLCGRAPINSTADGSTDTATTEVGGLSYGGNLPGDSSGRMEYVRLEYVGGAIDGNAELNGLSVYAAGDQTIIDYVQIYKGSDDGFEFFGGTVDANHLVVTDAEDDSIDWTEGWTGSITDVYVVQNVGIPHDSGFEMDGFNTDFSNEGGYFSAPTVTNVTVIGDQDSGRAFRLRAGSRGIFSNILVSDFGRGFVIQDDEPGQATSQGVVDGDTSVTDISFTNVATTVVLDELENVITEGDVIFGDAANATGTDFATWGAGWARMD
ncbi:multidrug transporter [Winogradskyella sp. DF17]|uniref:Multidrug transporter n=1 Tax=Winogradskyella pelagia TaxID=2819984 RepID=A0ABS3SYC0_9FLAO|nr:multidrug transporter [Winogradskyella sp. DF17]MBO3115467.1 multidrug transporter [Winogradskyella sp. DF17]